MTHVIPISSTLNNVPLIPQISFTTRKHFSLKSFNHARFSTKQAPLALKYIVPLSTSVSLFPQLRTNLNLHSKLRATATGLAIEAVSPVSNEDPPSENAKSSTRSAAPARTPRRKRPKPTRKSEMPPVKPEELVPGTTFTGKVRSVQPFGAFVDFGAFTDGLVHVSNLSDSYVKDVGDIVYVGQEVTVRLVEAKAETGRISLTMRESDENKKLQERKESSSSDDISRLPRNVPPRSNQKASKFVKGQDLEGTVKNFTRSGTFISLPEGEEGFLPQEEELDGGLVSMMSGYSLEVGQEVSVRVLRISRGKVTLTMKKEEAVGDLDSQLCSRIIHKATNPFLFAFRQNKDFALFLDERNREKELLQTTVAEDTSYEYRAKHRDQFPDSRR